MKKACAFTFLYFFITSAFGKISIIGDYILFLPEGSISTSGAKDGYSIEEFSRFNSQYVLDRNKIGGLVKFQKNENSTIFFHLPFIETLIQGANFAVSKSAGYAVLYSYSCELPVASAETPKQCKMSAALVDNNGRVKSEAEGDFERVEIHDKRPYFMLIRSSCCDGPVYAELYGINHTKLCSIENHRNNEWVGNKSIICSYKEGNGKLTSKTVRFQ